MKYPAVIHTDNGIDYGVFLPDIPGVFPAGIPLRNVWSTYRRPSRWCARPKN
ncbi:type II toxin-antitoxin system HicB family antitoxin [uncultured Mailhella sp.]|uniref:type II toxin-antitoxin system HicB family antitoxin n=1 Tax=uncultured Mailhella sp. TaxID=1981031 RepID=UPI00344CCF5A